MFSDRLDALMRIAGVSNSLLAREVHMDPSHLGRLRSGARPLPKRHEFLGAACAYLAGRIRKDYQVEALRNLTGIGGDALASPEGTARFLERWLLGQGKGASEAAGLLVSGFSRAPEERPGTQAADAGGCAPRACPAYLYGNEGKRRAAEQLLLAALRRDEPGELLLFSDEDMAWLYEDPAFAARWSRLFSQALERGSRARVIHTVSRDLDEMLEAVAKWTPLYMTGGIEPYFYPRLRDGVFRRTLFVAPGAAAVASTSVRQDTDGMLNLFLTDPSAVDALAREFDRYLALCRPLMRVFTARDAAGLREAADGLAASEGEAVLCCSLPPLFAMPEGVVRELAALEGDGRLVEDWRLGLAAFEAGVGGHGVTLMISDPGRVLREAGGLRPVVFGSPVPASDSYTVERYALHVENLDRMAERHPNLRVVYLDEPVGDSLIYVKEGAGAIMAKGCGPEIAFAICERGVVEALWEHLEARRGTRR